MSVVSYDSKKIIPAPFVNFTKTYQTTGDGEKVGSNFAISLQGTIVSFKGSPSSSGTWWTVSDYPPDETISNDASLAALIRKEEAIRELFSVDGRSLEVQAADGSQPMKCNPRVTNINFAAGNWYNRVQYSVDLEADVVYVNGTALGEDSFTEYISTGSESWSFETDDARAENADLPRTYRLTHSVSAQGKRFFNDAGNLQKPAWQWAKDWVTPKLGFNTSIALSSGINKLPSFYQGYNHVRNENTDERGGSYSVTETWIMSSGNALEDFTISTRDAVAGGNITVSIEGNIVGLETRDSDFFVTSTKYNNANTKFTAIQSLLHTRAQTYSSVTLNSSPTNTTIGRNPVNGTISYSYEYDDRPSNLITNSKSEVISVQDSFNVDVFAAIGVLGRSAGPVLQNINTKQPTTRSLSMEIIFPAASGSATNRLVTSHPRNVAAVNSDINDVISAVEPVGAGLLNNAGTAASTSYIGSQTENWDGNTGRYSRQISWTWE